MIISKATGVYRMKQTIRVDYTQQQDWFVATSADLRGLFVAAKSLSDVYDDMKDAIKLLYKSRFGSDVQVTRVPSPQNKPASEMYYSIEPVAA
jgi:hypothetical protein